MTIKQSPADFAVEEVLAAAVRDRVAARPAPFTLYRIDKEGLTTPQAAAGLAKALGVRPGEVAWAGLKDRHARTTQHVSVPLPPGAGAPATAEGPGWRAERLGWLDAPLAADAIAANRFRIVVRDLSREACERMDEAARLLESAPRQDNLDHPIPAGGDSAVPSALRPPHSSLLLVNYFGDQRFGSARHGGGFLAKPLIRGEFEEALRLAIAVWARKDSRRQKDFKRAVAEGWGRWQDLAASLPKCPERRAVEHLARSPDDFRGAVAALPYDLLELAVHAYQSHLWNAIARRLVAERCTGRTIEAADPFGVMRFPAAASVPDDLEDLELPVLGRDSKLAGPWRSAAEAVLAEEGVTTDVLRAAGLRRPRFGEVGRRLFVEASNVTLSPPEPDDLHPRRLRRAVAFDLPRGAYATVLLRALGQ